MGAMYATVRLGVLTALVVICGCATAQTISTRVEPITSALRAGAIRQSVTTPATGTGATSPKNPQLWTFVALPFLARENKKEALGAFAMRWNFAPDYLPALEGAAQIEYESGGKDAAPLLKKILKLRPADPTSHAMLAVLAYRRGDCAAAVPHFEQSRAVVDSQPGASRSTAIAW